MAKRNSRKKAVRKQHQLKMKEHDDRNDEEDSMEKEEEQPVQENDVSSDDDDGDDNDAGDDQGSNDDDSDNDSDDEEEDDMDVAAVFQGTSNGAHENDDDDSDDDDDDDDETEEAQTRAAATAAAASMNSEEYTFDMRNLLAISSDQLPMASLYNKDYKPTSNSAKPLTIPLDASQGLTVDEDYLLHCATAGCTQMIKALWQLPTDQSDAGPLVTLPGYEEIRLPRALPPPPPKGETKWEKFAKAKGIPLNKEKRSRKVWDEGTQSWMYRHGYEKANKKDQQWPIMEVGANDDPYEDPWEKLREAKRARIEQNTERRMKNQERAGNLAKGATNRATKSREMAYQMGKQGGTKDRETLPTGVPVDLKNASVADGGGGGQERPKLRGKSSTLAALSAVQRSTASLGKFDKMREGEPERRKTLNKSINKKRKPGTATDQKVLSSESASSMKILKAVMNGGVAKDKAIRKGQMAKGETAYEYDYDDGLGASSFRKKKGRAGAGKMKKMTKKRAK